MEQWYETKGSRPLNFYYYFLDAELIAVRVLSRSRKDCRGCVATYYFSGEELIYTKEKNLSYDINELLATAKKYISLKPY